MNQRRLDLGCPGMLDSAFKPNFLILEFKTHSLQRTGFLCFGSYSSELKALEFWNSDMI